jgi:hypothetical protein
MNTNAIDYYIAVTVSAVGVLQLAASFGGLRGLLFLTSPLATRLIGLILPLASVVWFFATGTRNISDHLGGLNSNQVALLFFLGNLTAWVLTVTVTSIVNSGRLTDPQQAVGLSRLRSDTFYRALRHSIRRWTREWRTLTKPYFSE